MVSCNCHTGASATILPHKSLVVELTTHAKSLEAELHKHSRAEVRLERVEVAHAHFIEKRAIPRVHEPFSTRWSMIASTVALFFMACAP